MDHPGTQEIEAYWQDFYSQDRSARVPDEPSLFAREVHGRLRDGASIVDVGAGTGRDTIYFAERGSHTLAIDAAPAAIDSLSLTASKRQLPVRALLAEAGELGTHETMGRVLSELRGVGPEPPIPLALYSRFFLHAVTEHVQHAFLAWASSALLTGDSVFLEYRTRSIDEYEFGSHYRREIDTMKLDSELSSLGFKHIHSEVSDSFAPLGKERPLVGRTLATR